MKSNLDIQEAQNLLFLKFQLLGNLILRETNFGELRTSESVILTFLGAHGFSIFAFFYGEIFQSKKISL